MPCHDTAASVAALRHDVDRIDSAILSLMERRLSLSRAMAAAKRTASTDLLLRPDRQEEVTARLIAQATAMPQSSILRIWHELMALNLQAQRPVELVVHAPRHPVAVTARAHARFGAAKLAVPAPSVAAALERARQGSAIAVIELDQHDGWWRVLADDPVLAIIDELRAEGGRGSALAVGRVPREHLAQQRQWLVLEEAELAARLCRGEAVCPLAASGSLRLCIVEHGPALLQTAA